MESSTIMTNNQPEQIISGNNQNGFSTQYLLKDSLCSLPPFNWDNKLQLQA